jgi:transcriptional regulator with XRE-family HTH domain
MAWTLKARGTRAINKSLRSKWHIAVVTVIAASRRQCGLTQEQLAAALQWHRSRVARIESGERRVDVPEFIAIADGLKIDPVLLLARVLRWL